MLIDINVWRFIINSSQNKVFLLEETLVIIVSNYERML